MLIRTILSQNDALMTELDFPTQDTAIGVQYDPPGKAQCDVTNEKMKYKNAKYGSLETPELISLLRT